MAVLPVIIVESGEPAETSAAGAGGEDLRLYQRIHHLSDGELAALKMTRPVEELDFSHVRLPEVNHQC